MDVLSLIIIIIIMSDLKCYSSEKLIALNTLHKVFSTWNSFFTAESTEAMQIKFLAQGHNILMSGFEQSTSNKKPTF